MKATEYKYKNIKTKLQISIFANKSTKINPNIFELAIELKKFHINPACRINVEWKFADDSVAALLYAKAALISA